MKPVRSSGAPCAIPPFRRDLLDLNAICCSSPDEREKSFCRAKLFELRECPLLCLRHPLPCFPPGAMLGKEIQGRPQLILTRTCPHKKSFRIGNKLVPQNCSSFPDGHFPAIKPASGMSEIGTGETANLDAKQMLYLSSEFFGALDFLLLFGQCKK